jgi:hypothetical protein
MAVFNNKPAEEKGTGYFMCPIRPELPEYASISSHHLTSYVGKRSMNASRSTRCSVLLC